MSNIRLKDLTLDSAPADGDLFPMDSASEGCRAITWANAKAQMAAALVAAPSTFKLAPLDAGNKVPSAYLPSGYPGSYVGTADGAAIPSPSGKTPGDYYIITTAGGGYLVGDLAVVNAAADGYDRVTPGTKQIAEGGTGATTAAGARVNLDVLSIAEGLGRVAAQSGGLVCSGNLGAGQRAHSTLGGSIGAGDFTFWLRLKAPEAHNTSLNGAIIAALGPSITTINHNNAFSITYGTGADLFVRVGNEADVYRRRTLTGLRSAYENKAIDLVVTRAGTTLKVYVNGAEWTSYTDAGAGGFDTSITSTYAMLGQCDTSNGKVIGYYCAAGWNRALSAAEVANLLNFGIALADKWGALGGASGCFLDLDLTIGAGYQAPDRSTNGQHALLTTTGMTHKLSKRTGEVRGTLSWSGTHEAKNLLADQAVLPANARVESISINPASTGGNGIQDMIVGDGTTGNYWVALTTDLAAGWQDLTLAKRYPAGAGDAVREITVDPDANADMSAQFVIRYSLSE